MEGEEFKWEERETCWMSKNEQCGKAWQSLRVGRITMSMISSVCGRSFFSENSGEKLASIICGTSTKSFTPSQSAAMLDGIKYEPLVRGWLSKTINKKIEEVGLAVWKEDPRFGGSLDGEIDDMCIEIKIPVNGIYRKLVEHLEAIKKGYSPPPLSYHGNIFDSHYDQMIGNCIITGKTECIYTVASLKDANFYVQKIPVDLDHWKTQLYPKACHFYDAYVKPHMLEYGIKRVDPPGVWDPDAGI